MLSKFYSHFQNCAIVQYFVSLEVNFVLIINIVLQLIVSSR